MTAGNAVQLDAALCSALQEAAEALAFAEAVPADAPLEEPLTCVVLPLLEPEPGLLFIRMAQGDARALSQTAWGPIELSDEHIEQFLFEFANVLAGQYLAVAHPDAPVRIGFAQRIGASDCPPAVAATVWDLDGCRMEVGVAA
ncbi:MAG: hypothetical protein R3F59_27505 [Myxococcota bacterium]